jgi:hypothetical protein
MVLAQVRCKFSCLMVFACVCCHQVDYVHLAFLQAGIWSWGATSSLLHMWHSLCSVFVSQ